MDRGPSGTPAGVAVFERAFGVTLSDVHAHVGGPDVVAALGVLGTRAAARRDHVYFDVAEPREEEVGHELAHVVQLRGGSPGAPHRPGTDAELEAEANAAAAAAIRGDAAPIRLTAEAGRTLQLTGNVLSSAIMRDLPGDAGGAPIGRDIGARIRPGPREILEGQGDWWRMRNAHGQAGRPSSSLIMTAEARGRLIGQVALRQAAPPVAGTALSDPEAVAWLAAITAARAHMEGYEQEVRSSTFLGATVVGHTGFLARLQLAEQYLQGRHAGATGAALRVAVGIDPIPRTTRGWNLRTGTDPHAVGSAIDLNYASNPYVRGNTTAPLANAAYRTLATHALEFSGQSTERTLPAYHTSNQGAAWDELHVIDAAIERHFSMLSATPRGLGDSGGQVLAGSLDPANRERVTSNVRAFLTARGQTPADTDVAQWVGRILSDFRQQRSGGSGSNWSDSNGAPRDDVGVLNLQRDIPVALCDVAGMRWGATGFSEPADGDIMHFDASEVLTLGDHRVSVHLRGLSRNPYLTQGDVAAWRRQTR